MFLYPVVYSVAPLFKVIDKCLTYIVIELMAINEMFCGGAGAVTYNYVIVPPSHSPVYPSNQAMHNITGLSGNTSYLIITSALRNGNELLYNTTRNESTLQSLSKYV